MWGRSAWRRWTSLRRTVKTLDAIERHLAEHNRLLGALVERFAPPELSLTAEQQKGAAPRETSVDHFDPVEGVLAAEFIAKQQHEFGRTPTEEEVIAHLAELMNQTSWADRQTGRGR